jgi:alpha-L-rhamnosidase
MKFKFLALTLAIALLFGCNKKSSTIITNLRCENIVNPLAVEVSQPRLSWIMESSENGQKQTAYQIIATDNAGGTLWDSGKKDSDQSIDIKYEGKMPASGQRVNWKVNVWDAKSNMLTSETAFFDAGLAKADWKAKWVGVKFDDKREKNFDGLLSKWIWYPEKNSNKDQPQGYRYFTRTIKIENPADLLRASFMFTIDDSGELFINGTRVGQSSWMNVVTLDVKEFLKNGDNVFELTVTNKWGGAGYYGQLYLRDAAGKETRIPTDKEWKVGKDKTKYVAAAEIADYGKGETREWLSENYLYPQGILPAPFLRKPFTIEKKIKSAKIYASALGVYELHVNGKKATDNYFAPGFTDYKKRVLYQTYDVTNLLTKGDNVLGGVLGDGWYAGAIGWGHATFNYGDYPLRLLAQLQIEFEDGTTQTIGTDDSWKGSFGPIVMSQFLDGENYDARLEKTGWNNVKYDDKDWQAVDVKEVTENILADPGVTVNVMQSLNPKSTYLTKSGVLVYDMGQNMVGWAKIKVKGKAGDKVTLRFAEMLNPDSTIYVENLRSATSTDTYILKGDGEEEFEPHFTFHGFRYVEVTGFPNKANVLALTGSVVHSNTPFIGKFECSSALVNQIQSNVTWGQRGNFVSVPTDCPQRDERLGWMADAQIFCKTSTLNADVAAFFNKWINDINDAQSPEGAYSDVSPRVVDKVDGCAAWGDAGVIIPYQIYQAYGNTRALEESYPNMVKWIEFLQKNNPDYKWVNKRANDFGDWLSTNANTDKEVLASAYYAYSTWLVSDVAKTLGKTEDAKKFEDLFGKIKETFIKTYVSPDGRIRGNTQTSYILALRFNLLPDSLRPIAAKYLVEDIKAHNYHHTTGFLGVGHMMPILTQSGNIETAYKLLNNETFPSWGYMIKNGATTIWERWDGYTTDKGFQDKGMNSFNHYSLGSVGEWLYNVVAGINAAAPGYKKIVIKPIPGGGLTYAKAEYNSVYGKIVSDWKIESGKLKLKVVIPANTTATVYVPATNVSAKDLKSTGTAENSAVFEIGGGSYEFEGDYK